MDIVIKIQNLNYEKDQRVILNSFNWEISKNENWVILGKIWINWDIFGINSTNIRV